MFKKSKKKIIGYKDIIKKINYQLTSNFFSIDEFSQLSFKQGYKIIKVISKMSNLKLKRRELKILTAQIRTIKNDKKTSKDILIVASLFNWSISKVQKTYLYFCYKFKNYLTYIFIFRLDRKHILRI